MVHNFAITGFAGSGKDTLAAFISEDIDKQTYALAYPIKKLVSNLFNISIDKLEDRSLKEKELTYHIDITSLEAAGLYYNEIGLDSYQEFHDAWETWISLLDLEYRDETYFTRISIRKALQLLGTEWGRGLKDTIWLELAPDNSIITDIRFDNEAQFFIDKGYYVIEVVRKQQEIIKENSHASEKGVLPNLIDIIIYNDSTLRDLREKSIYMLSLEDPIGYIG